MIGIFMESNTNLGIMYNSYKDIPAKTKSFMDFINNTIEYAHTNGVPTDDIKSELTKFKGVVKSDMTKKSDVDPKHISDVIADIKSTKTEVEGLLKKLGTMRKKFRFGDNLIKGIIIKPKIYTNSIKDEDHERVNTYMRNASNSLDWIEKIILDLMNLCDQDLNLLSVMKEVRYRKVYESADLMSDEEEYIPCGDMMNMEVDTL